MEELMKNLIGLRFDYESMNYSYEYYGEGVDRSSELSAVNALISCISRQHDQYLEVCQEEIGFIELENRLLGYSSR